MKKSRITFKRVPERYHPDSWSIRYAGKELGRISRRGPTYYWYSLEGPQINTVSQPGAATSFEGCQQEVIAHFKPLVDKL